MTTEHVHDEHYWDNFYAEKDQIWSGRPNAALVHEVAGLTPGTALDLGCGEGADAIWLAGQGWTVTAVDISAVALERAARHAEQAGVADRIDWQQHELGKSFPDGQYDLVSAQFLHSVTELPREAILRTASRAVAPGGVLLIEGHLGFPPGEENPHPEIHFPSPAEVIEDLELAEGEWEVLVSREHGREQIDRTGKLIHRRDSTVKLRRLPS
ncbi:Methyltransferase type 12 [Kribbella flavida DSM 17836]|uniref:Methyltransferase type 12 n=1 Tax=Kribbella flavida (strain DSM 17836 / JCM 10339 / NBRC 14399) TaxID=479435 RepID=D2PLR2_KRIFD|nr:class I SAM-dependent methyltransferase [Kribbella flavida]ADB32492.1 Methyltransferase type 12 [Kribbella flavida DSM 17836]